MCTHTLYSFQKCAYYEITMDKDMLILDGFGDTISKSPRIQKNMRKLLMTAAQAACLET